MPSKKLITFLIFSAVLLGAFSPMFAGVAEAATLAEKILDPYLLLGPIGLIFSPNSPLFSGLAEIFLTIGAFLLSTSGIFFDLVIDFTIVNMSKNLATGSGGIGDSINTVWSILRDLANMVFIFVLLWAAIQLILGLSSEMGKTIRNIVIVGLLINFSLFFTKVVIDASNIASIGFLNSINAAAQAAPPVKIAGGYTLDKGFSSLIVGAVRIQSFFSPDGIGTPSGEVQGGKMNILLTGLMGFILMLVLAIVLLVASVLFVTRYLLLIFIMILSPLALIGYVLPTLSGRTQEWWQALKNQAFFAPIFLLMLWVAFKLITTKGFIAPELIQGQSFAAIGIKAPSTMGLLLNFVLAVGMIIGALILSKKMASSTYGFSKIAGGVATGAMGGAAIAGRQTFGRAASRLAESQKFQNWAGRSAIGQKMLQGTRGVAKGSFDVRGVADTKIGKSVGADKLLGDIGQVGEKAKGGFDARIQRKTASKEKFAQSLSTDAQRQAYAARQASKFMVRGGSRSSANSMFGMVGRSNRVVASKILNSQLQPWITQRDNLNNTLQNQQNRDTALNQQLNTAQANLITLQNIQNPTPQQLQQIAQMQNNINNVQGQIQTNQNNMANTQNQLGHVTGQVTNLTNQINNLGLTNPRNTIPLTPQQQAANAAAQAAGQPPPHAPRAARADEQNY